MPAFNERAKDSPTSLRVRGSVRNEDLENVALDDASLGTGGGYAVDNDAAQRELYNLRPVQQIINLLVAGEVKELKPVFDLKYVCRYPALEKVTGLEPNEIPGLLDRMATRGILDSFVEERVLTCNKCGSVNIAVRYRCPHCKSSNLNKQKTLEHVSCGYVDAESKFLTKGLVMVCPRCGVEFRTSGPDLRVRDSWFFCGDCRKRAKEPAVKYECRQCDAIMSTDDVYLTNLDSYTLAEVVDASSLVLVAPIKDVVEKLGWHVESPGILVGKSGVSHRFDMVCSRSDTVVVIDLAYSSVMVNDVPIINLFASSFDTEAKHAIMIAVPAAADSAKKLADQYRIPIIEGRRSEEVCERIRQVLVSLLSLHGKESR